MTSAIATLDLGLGFEAGLSVVILAIYLDRVTAAIGQGDAKHGLAAGSCRGKQRRQPPSRRKPSPTSRRRRRRTSPEALDSIARIHS